MIDTLDKYLRKIYAEDYFSEISEDDSKYESDFLKWKSNLSMDDISKYADEFDLIS
jgi:hypothetical protein